MKWHMLSEWVVKSGCSMCRSELVSAYDAPPLGGDQEWLLLRGPGAVNVVP